MKTILRSLAVLLFSGLAATAAPAVLLGWNNLGMHCMDSDYSVFSILPPYNTIYAQLIVNGHLVSSSNGYTVTYQAVADRTGSINRTSAGKGNFYDFTSQLYAPLLPDQGLAGWSMPGAGNTPQRMLFENENSPAPSVSTPADWFRAEGIPITPYDDNGKKNPYPMMRLVARDSANTVIATSDIVLPVSDEMDCRLCHGSGAGAAARPSAGWVNDTNPDRDYRLNILRLHDERRDAGTWPEILSTNGFNPAGLYATVINDGKPVLCARCHLSEALPGTGVPGLPALTRAVHSLHAGVTDPLLGMTLESSLNRAACYRCHPGSTTRCLRGAMGSAVAPDGSMTMQCQSCHGTMSQVGAADRIGWLMEPNCQSCHTGTATHNNGQIRYTSVFEPGGTVRVPVDTRFATTPNTPAAGLSLYRFSIGHGGLQCAACHGSTHAEFPASHPNDNVRNTKLQGHAGVVSDCGVCHGTVPVTSNGGPHGMHPIGPAWVSAHQDLSEDSGTAQCRACHGTDYRGTVLSRALGDRTLNAFGRTIKLFRGADIGCYLCHNGPDGEGSNDSVAPVVSSSPAQTPQGQPVSLALQVSSSRATVRIITQPAHGTVGLVGRTATYYPDPGFTGTDSFTFAAYDGAKNSNLGVATLLVGGAAAADYKGVYTGLFEVPGAFSATNAGPVTLTVSSSGSFSGSIKLAGSSLGFTGRLSPAGEATAVIKRPGGSLYLSLVASVLGDTARMAGTLDAGSWQATLAANRSYFDGVLKSAPDAGKYTLVLSPATAVGSSPMAVATLTVSAAGRLSVTGSLATGTSFAKTVAVAKSGEWPLSIPLNGGQGLLQGWLRFSNSPGSDIEGDFSWAKPATPGNVRYPGAFNVTGSVLGSHYTAPPAGTRIVDLQQGRLSFGGDANHSAFEAGFTLPVNNKPLAVTAGQLALSFTIANGSFKGSATKPGTSIKLPFKGVVLQKSNTGAGYYLDTNFAGPVTLGP